MPGSEWPERLKQSLSGTRVVFKLMGVGLLVLILLIPLEMIDSVLRERIGMKATALEEITSTWGRDQRIAGPVLVVPYIRRTNRVEERTVNGKVVTVNVTDTAVGRATFLPQEWRAEGSLDPQPRYIGIFKTVVYSAGLRLEGRFDPPDLEALSIRPEDLLWSQATLSVAITDLRGAREALKLTWGDTEYTFRPGTSIPGFTEGVHCDLRDFRGFDGPLAFRIPLTCQGSSKMLLAPLGTSNEARLTSTWPDPGFRGAYLPVERKVSVQGFEAAWKMSHYGRNFPQAWTDREAAAFNEANVEAILFGPELMMLVDSYRSVERSIKYGMLFMALVFTAFFIFETVGGMRIHAFQYILVGAALCLFYLLLLSLSEFLFFGVAYLAAAAGATAMISLYAAAVLSSGRKAGWILVLVSTVYGFLYVTLQMQDYALLAGSIGLFLALGAVMFVTRKIDWYA